MSVAVRTLALVLLAAAGLAHAQGDPKVLRALVPVPPAGSSVMVRGLTVNVHAAACVTVYVLPAIVSVPCAFGGLEDCGDRLLARAEVGGEPALVAHARGQSALVQELL